MTAADGAPEFYNKGNIARYEDIKEAIDVDHRLRHAYFGHSRFYIVDNKVTHFNKKIDICVEIVSKILGMPSSNTHHKKFLIKIANPEDHSSLGFPEGCKIDTFEVIETIIKPLVEGPFKTAIETLDSQFITQPSASASTNDQRNVEIYLRKRGKVHAYSYTQEIRYTVNNQRIVKSRIITAREYLELIQQRTPQMNTLQKKRTSFVYQNQAYMIETILNIDGKPTFLRAEKPHDGHSITIPPFI